MLLLTKELRETIPPLYATEKQKDPTVYCRFFTPDAQWTWYVTEFDGKDTFFGLVDGLYAELGYFRLSELQKIRGAFGLPIERDKGFEPCKLSDAWKLVHAPYC
jgi:hypothetical protein